MTNVPRPHSKLLAALATAAATLTAATVSTATPVAAQDGLRVGIYVGGTSTVGLLLDYLDGSGSTEITLGTFSFRDLSVSVVRRQRIGGGEVQGTVGLGVWAVAALPRDDDERTGLALVARAPVGLEWAAGGGNYLNLDVNLNRALLVRRTDPGDDTPPASRIVPLPGASWRWRTN
jgi:hypothetical protein